MDKASKVVADFAEERDWRQFHTPENLAKSIAIVAPDDPDASGDSENPETYDKAIASSVGVLALAGLGGFVALRNKRRG